MEGLEVDRGTDHGNQPRLKRVRRQYRVFTPPSRPKSDAG